jgi:hypothetical protein
MFQQRCIYIPSKPESQGGIGEDEFGNNANGSEKFIHGVEYGETFYCGTWIAREKGIEPVRI